MMPGEGDERTGDDEPLDDDEGRRGDGRQQDRSGDAPGKGFADLVGPTKPLRPGPARLPPTTGVPADRDPTAGSSRDSEAPTAAFRWPDPEDRGLAAAPGVSDRQLQRLGRGEPAPGERIDLHGVRRDAAAIALERRLEAARARGLRSVLVIHGIGRRSGSGEAVLREALPGWLSGRIGRPHVLAFAPAPPPLGDRGATIVLLRRPKR